MSVSAHLTLQSSSPRNLGCLGSAMNKTVHFFRADVPGHKNSTLEKTVKYVAAFFLTLLLTATLIGIPLVLWAVKEVTLQRAEEKQLKLVDSTFAKNAQWRLSPSLQNELLKGKKHTDHLNLDGTAKQEELVLSALNLPKIASRLILTDEAELSKLLDKPVMGESEKDNVINQLRNDLEQTRVAAREAIESIQQKLTQAAQERASALTQLEEAQATAKDLPSKIESLNANLATSEQTITTLREQLAQAQAAASGGKPDDAITALHAQLNKANEERTSALTQLAQVQTASQSEIDSLKTTLATAEQNITTLGVQLAQAQKTVSEEVQKAIAPIQAKLDQATQEHQSARAELEKAQAAANTLQSEKDIREREFAAAQESIKTLQQQLTQAQAAASGEKPDVIASLHAQLNKANEELTSALTQLAQVQTASQSEIDSLKTTLATAEQNITALGVQLAQAQKGVSEEVQKAIAPIQAKLDQATQEHQSARTELEKAQAAANTLQSEKDKREREFAAAQQSVTGLMKQLTDARAALSSAEEASKKTIADLQQKVAEGEKSKTKKELTTTKLELADTKQKLKTKEEESSAQKKQIGELETKLTVETLAKASAFRQVNTADARVAELKEALKEKEAEIGKLKERNGQLDLVVRAQAAKLKKFEQPESNTESQESQK